MPTNLKVQTRLLYKACNSSYLIMGSTRNYMYFRTIWFHWIYFISYSIVIRCALLMKYRSHDSNHSRLGHDQKSFHNIIMNFFFFFFLGGGLFFQLKFSSFFVFFNRKTEFIWHSRTSRDLFGIFYMGYSRGNSPCPTCSRLSNVSRVDFQIVNILSYDYPRLDRLAVIFLSRFRGRIIIPWKMFRCQIVWLGWLGRL